VRDGISGTLFVETSSSEMLEVEESPLNVVVACKVVVVNGGMIASTYVEDERTISEVSEAVSSIEEVVSLDSGVTEDINEVISG